MAIYSSVMCRVNIPVFSGSHVYTSPSMRIPGISFQPSLYNSPVMNIVLNINPVSIIRGESTTTSGVTGEVGFITDGSVRGESIT